MKSISINYLIIKITIIGICLLVILTTLSTNWFYLRYSHNELIQQGTEIAHSISKESKIPLITGSKESAFKVLHAGLNYPNVLSISIYDNVGELFSRAGDPAEVLEQELKTSRISKILVQDASNTISIYYPIRVTEKLQEFPAQEKIQSEYLGYVFLLLSKETSIGFGKKLVTTNIIITIVVSALIITGLILSIRRITKPLKILITQITDYNTNKSIEPTIDDASTPTEVRSLGEHFYYFANELREREIKLLDQSNNLENIVAKRTTELKEARDQALTASLDKTQLLKRINNIIEKERKSISRELHDHLNSELIAIKLKLDDIKDTFPRSACDFDIDKHIDEILVILESVYKSSREIIRNLRPEVIDSMGLIGAIEDLMSTYNRNNPVCDYELDSEGFFDHLEYNMIISIYRIIQESLANAAKYSKATLVTIKLYQTSDENPDELYLQIAENGIGFDPDNIATGLGLIGIRERCNSLNGRVNIESVINEGTTITVFLPNK